MTSIVPVVRADRLLDHVGDVIRGTFWVMRCRDKVMSNGLPQLQLTLEDGSDAVLGYVWPEHLPHVGMIPTRAVVSVIAEVRRFDDRPVLRIRQLREASAHEVELGAGLLPKSLCPATAHKSLERLVALEQALPEPLRGFLKCVLLDPLIALPLLSCRGSAEHHHAEPGGLLLHCTELLELSATIAWTVMPRDPMAPAMAQLGYLLHDLGKLRSVGYGCRPEHPFVLTHESMTIDLLAPHLKWLEAQDRELALALRYVLQYLATPAKARTVASYLVAEIVEFLDHCSAASHQGRDLSALLGQRPMSWGVDAGTAAAAGCAEERRVAGNG